jgi:hypothetical protein
MKRLNNILIFVVTSGDQSRCGCVLVTMFANVLLQADDNELRVDVGKAQIALKNIIGAFTATQCKNWIGRPKIFFILDESTGHDGYFDPFNEIEVFLN